MENAAQKIKQSLEKAVGNFTDEHVVAGLTTPGDKSHGDYASNIALVLFSFPFVKQQHPQIKSPVELAEKIVEELKKDDSLSLTIAKIETAKPGFINFFLSETTLLENLNKKESGKPLSDISAGQKILIEYAHPNTHKEMHIGHMRTLITGEALARILEAAGAEVFRANYQGDIGPHVAKALYGISKIMQEEGLSLEKVHLWNNKDKAHFLGRGYVRGNQDYETHKEEIDGINNQLYAQAQELMPLYEETRKWSLDYYDEFYKRFYTQFDYLFFERDMVAEGKETVKKNIGNVFREENGAVIFPGEEYGLHTRVFITQAGNPTYEGKEMANGFAEYNAFPFTRKIHIVASEQNGYFQVVFKALELIDAEKFEGKQHHVSMGMVQLVGRKMSSRTGEILTVDSLIDDVKKKVGELVTEGKIAGEHKEETAEEVAIGAIKYSVLKVGTGQDASFDIETSVSLDGNSGPYLQYTYARTQSVLAKVKSQNSKVKTTTPHFAKASRGEQNSKNIKDLQPEELGLLRTLYHFPEVVGEAAVRLSPNIVCIYLFELAQSFNLFYQKHKILMSEGGKVSHFAEASRDKGEVEKVDEGENVDVQNFRLALTQAVGKTLKQGLNLLGIESPERM